MGAGSVAILAAAWPKLMRRLLRPIRCASCRGMGYTLCGKCQGRGKTGCPALAAALGGFDGGGGSGADRGGVSGVEAENGVGAGAGDARLGADLDLRLSYCKSCFGRGRNACGGCEGTGIANNWLYGPAQGGGWGPRGEWPDPNNPPPMPPPPPPPLPPR